MAAHLLCTVIAMPLLWMIFAILFTTAVVFNSDQLSQNQGMSDAEVAAMSGSMLVYRNSVAAYREANPAFIGSVSDAALSLPTWYIKPPGLNNYVGAGASYVYVTTSLPGLVGALASKTESTSIGTNQGGLLSSPNTGSTGIPLPGQIPLSAVVIVQ
ncbi:type IV pilus biogenesis protein PilM [Pseudomonas sp. WS 5096]|uniref:Type IV pilus biogenesis protein PilM n=2 Tax=Pseudomonas cremoris TaxID=2724178 RepID=A0ABR6TH99_9PSED|nr:type IV pilus biogenesis protein PilM [Pseudomonas cremoris]